MNIANIPEELKAIPQWTFAKTTDEINPKRPYNPKTGLPASVVDPSTWGTFPEVVATGYHPVLMLTRDLGLAVIDLDRKKVLPDSEIEAQNRILAVFNTYTEWSLSTKGFHLLLWASFEGRGRHRGSIEVYQEARAILITGDIVDPSRASISRDMQPQLDALMREMPSVDPTQVLEEQPFDYEEPDWAVVERASNAKNGELFDNLCGNKTWEEMGYPSQSEADLALIKILSVYTKSNEQVRRIFLCSALGKRDKAQRGDYIGRTLAQARASEHREINVSELVANAAKAIEQQQPEAPPLPSTKPNSTLTYPPGLVGRIAQYFYQASIRPVHEMSIVAALAFTAGICGRSFNISASGLAQYLIVLAQTGTGKESVSVGIDALFAHVAIQDSTVKDFIGPAVFSSGPAMIRYLTRSHTKCFVSVLGEVGLTLRALSDPRANSLNTLTKRVFLDLYGKSGWQRTLRASVYSDSEKNTEEVQAPNVTLLGESTPEAFFDGLDPSHIAEGLIPRFSVIEYKGPRPPINPNHELPPDEVLVQEVKTLAGICKMRTHNNQCLAIHIDEQAKALLDTFNEKADAYINNANGEVTRMLWNRAHLKALKLAGLLAVGINQNFPTVTNDLARWAIDFVTFEVTEMTTRFENGDVGLGDGKQVLDLKKVIKNCLSKPSKDVPEPMRKDGLIPYRSLQRRTSQMASYRQDRLGATSVLKRAIGVLIDSGELHQVSEKAVSDKYEFNGLVYGVTKHWT